MHLDFIQQKTLFYKEHFAATYLKFENILGTLTHIPFADHPVFERVPFCLEINLNSLQRLKKKQSVNGKLDLTIRKWTKLAPRYAQITQRTELILKFEKLDLVLVSENIVFAGIQTLYLSQF